MQALLEPVPGGQPRAERGRDRRAGRHLGSIAVPLLRRRRLARAHRRRPPAGAPRAALRRDAPGPTSRSPSGSTASSPSAVRLLDAMGPVGQLARSLAPKQPLVAAELGRIRAVLRGQLVDVFGPELDRLGRGERAEVLAALDVACSWEAQHLLRQDQGVSGATACAGSWRGSIRRLLGRGGLMRGVGASRTGDRRAGRPGLGGRRAGPSCCTCWFPGHRRLRGRRRPPARSRSAPASACPRRSSPTTRCSGGSSTGSRRRSSRSTSARSTSSRSTTTRCLVDLQQRCRPRHDGARARRRHRRRARRAAPASSRPAPGPALDALTTTEDLMGRKILFITTDQQRYDTLGLQRRRRSPHAGGRRAGRRRASATSGPCRSRSCACRRARRCSPASTRARTACG